MKSIASVKEAWKVREQRGGTCESTWKVEERPFRAASAPAKSGALAPALVILSESKESLLVQQTSTL